MDGYRQMIRWIDRDRQTDKHRGHDVCICMSVSVSVSVPVSVWQTPPMPSVCSRFLCAHSLHLSPFLLTATDSRTYWSVSHFSLAPILSHTSTHTHTYGLHGICAHSREGERDKHHPFLCITHKHPRTHRHTTHHTTLTLSHTRTHTRSSLSPHALTYHTPHHTHALSHAHTFQIELVSAFGRSVAADYYGRRAWVARYVCMYVCMCVHLTTQALLPYGRRAWVVRCKCAYACNDQKTDRQTDRSRVPFWFRRRLVEIKRGYSGSRALVAR
jgi:hypothetical protein